MLRTFATLLLSGLALAAVSATAQAAPARVPGIESGSPNIVEVAGRCGRHAHYVRGHHTRSGRWVPSHCVRDRRR
jgi:hypothetical protein